MPLTAEDVRTFIAIRNLVRHTPAGEGRQLELLRLEAAFSEAGREAFRTWPSDRLTRELRHWRPAYAVERTQAGYRVRRLIKSRGRYASRPEAAGLTADQVARYRYLVRV